MTHTQFSAFGDPDLGQTLILAPEVTFARVRHVLADNGFVLDETTKLDNAEAPLAAAFSYRDARPHIVYSHNPVVNLRVLEVGTLPPKMRHDLVQDLPLLRREDVSACLGSFDDKQVLLGLWAACETERVDLLETARGLAENRMGIVRDEAAVSVGKLEKTNEAREGVLGLMGMVAQTAREVIGALDDPRVVENLLVTPQTAKGLFTADIAGEIAHGLRDKPLQCQTAYQGRTVIPETIKAAPAGLLRFHNMLSKPFPRGYRDAAGWMQPDQIWVTWFSADRGGAKTQFDGLVFTGSAWHLCPRPFRLIGAQLRRHELQYGSE